MSRSPSKAEPPRPGAATQTLSLPRNAASRATSPTNDQLTTTNAQSRSPQPPTAANLTVVYAQPHAKPEENRKLETQLANAAHASIADDNNAVQVSSTQALSGNRRVAVSARSASPAALNELREHLSRVGMVEHTVLKPTTKETKSLPVSPQWQPDASSFNEKSLHVIDAEQNANRLSHTLESSTTAIASVSKQANKPQISTKGGSRHSVREEARSPTNFASKSPTPDTGTTVESAADAQNRLYGHQNSLPADAERILRARHQSAPGHSPLEVLRDELGLQVPAALQRINSMAGTLAGALASQLSAVGSKLLPHHQATDIVASKQQANTTADESALLQHAQADKSKSLWQKLVNKQNVRESEAREQFKHVNVDMHEAIVRAFADDAQEEPPLPLYNAVVQEAYQVLKKVHKKNVNYARLRPTHPVVQSSGKRLQFLEELNKRVVDLI